MTPITIRVTPDTVVDIDAFAAQTFPTVCAKCSGQGILKSTGQSCPSCGGTGQVGIRADALRYLIHFALGQKFSPEARAMILTYENMFPVLAQGCRRVLQEASDELKDVIYQSVFGDEAETPPTPKIPKKRKKRRKS